MQKNPIQQDRAFFAGKYNAARSNLLLVVLFTFINLILLVSNSGTYFLFSAYLPYALADLGMFLTGRYPQELYEGMEDFVPADDAVYFVFLVAAVVILVLYLLSWFFSSKERVGWVWFALILFALDFIVLLSWVGFSVEILMDVLFHVWVGYYLVQGILSHKKMKALPAEEPIPVTATELPAEEAAEKEPLPQEESAEQSAEEEKKN